MVVRRHVDQLFRCARFIRPALAERAQTIRLFERIIPIVSSAGAVYPSTRYAGPSGSSDRQAEIFRREKDRTARIGKPRIEFGVIREILSIFVAVVSQAESPKRMNPPLDRRFARHLHAAFPEFFRGGRFLLAFSGGMDSTALGHLLRAAGVPFDAAHCNFHLRGEESLRDERFAVRQAGRWGVRLLRVGFQTECYARSRGLSIEMAARELRYAWFARCVEQGGYRGLITAHHGDDQVETVLLNLARGGALEGMAGIKPRKDGVFRPLLPFSREEIAGFARENTLEWVEDSSNATDDYTRNRLRHQVIPLLKGINPSLVRTVGENTAYLQDAARLLDRLADEKAERIIVRSARGERIDIPALLALEDAARTMLYRLLKRYALESRTDDVLRCLREGQPGAVFANERFRLLRDRQYLWVERPADTGRQDTAEVLISPETSRIERPIRLSFAILEDLPVARCAEAARDTAYFDADALSFPLTLRGVRAGDVFRPLGMGGRQKKVAKLLKDEKLSLFDKSRTQLLCSADGRIAWVAGLRQGEDFRVTDATRRVLQVRMKRDLPQGET